MQSISNLSILEDEDLSAKRPVVDPKDGTNLLLLPGKTPELYARAVGSHLFTKEEIVDHCLSPVRSKRPDFSPSRKSLMKGLFLNVIDNVIVLPRAF